MQWIACQPSIKIKVFGNSLTVSAYFHAVDLIQMFDLQLIFCTVYGLHDNKVTTEKAFITCLVTLSVRFTTFQ